MGSLIQGIVTELDEFDFSKRPTQNKERTPGGDLGKDQFLQLLVCQMKNQDPLEPEKDTDFIAQLAQFSALEQMQNLNETTVNSQAFGLVGKYVKISAKSPSGKYTDVNGVVDYITMKDGEAQLSVDGKLYKISDLVEVKDSYYAIQKYLPSVEKTEAVYDKSNKKQVDIKINLGEGDYAASSVVVVMNGEAVKNEFLSYKDGVLSILPGALDELETGDYEVGLYFDDPYSTSIRDKVTIKVTDSGIEE